MALHEPLEIEYWFSQVFSGTPLIFTLVMVLFITYLSAKLKMEMSTFVVFMLMFAAIMMAKGDNALIVLIILIGAPILFWIFRRVAE